MTFRFLVCEPQCARRSWNRSRRNGEEKGQGREKDVDLFALLGIGRRVDTILHHGHCLTYSHLQQHHTQHTYSLSRPPVSVYTVINTISHHTCCLHTRRELGRRDRQTERERESERAREEERDEEEDVVRASSGHCGMVRVIALDAPPYHQLSLPAFGSGIPI